RAGQQSFGTSAVRPLQPRGTLYSCHQHPERVGSQSRDFQSNGSCLFDSIGWVGVVLCDPAETDWQITGPRTLDLRAQRLGIGMRRIYTIAVSCTNSSQLSSTANVTVSVPHDQRQ